MSPFLFFSNQVKKNIYESGLLNSLYCFLKSFIYSDCLVFWMLIQNLISKQSLFYIVYFINLINLKEYERYQN
ncbi:hypothetical protein F991_00736 [Acinetobacter sp. CIP-A165]|nr:hypothetical protein F991_00736 [Acinetobacter sp. CIP-A165]